MMRIMRRRGAIHRRCLASLGLMLVVAGGPVNAAGLAFGVNGLDFSLSSYRIEADGELRHLGHRPLDKSPPAVAMHPSGRFVFALSQTASNIAVFRLDRATAALAPVAGSPFPARAKAPFTLAFHPSGRFVYVAARFSGVGAYAFDVQTGTLTPLPGSPFAAGERTRSLRMHPSGDYLYAVNGYSNTVSAYRVDSVDGGLMPLPGSPYAVSEVTGIDYTALGMADVAETAGGIPYDIATDPQGRFLFVANWATASVSVFRVDGATGVPALVAGSPFFVGFNPYRLRVHPSGRFLVVAHFSASEVSVQAIDAASGRLTAVAGSPFASGGVGPVALSFSGDGRRLYVPHYESNEIALLDMDVSSGALTLRQVLETRMGPWDLTLTEGVPMARSAPLLIAARGAAGLAWLGDAGPFPRATLDTGGTVRAVAARPDGRFAYAVDADRNTLTAVYIDATGLRAVDGGTVATGRQPGAIAIDVNGWYLYAVNQGDDTLMAWRLDPDSGIPRPVQRAPVRTGRRPVAVTLDPAARYAFVVNAGSNDISVFRYLSSTMPLLTDSRKYGSPFAAGREPVALAVEPNGQYAYVANAGSDDISAYRIHHQTGALSALPGSPFETAKRPRDLTAHPSGRWLFVASAGASQVSVYGIERGLGALTRARHELPLPVPPRALRLSPGGEVLWVLSEDGRRLLRLGVDAATGGLKLLSDESLERPMVDLAVVESRK